MLVQSGTSNCHFFANALYDTAKTVVMTGAAEVALRIMQQPGVAEIGLGVTSFAEGSFWLLRSAVCKLGLKSSSGCSLSIAAAGTAMVIGGLGLIYTGIKKCTRQAAKDPDYMMLSKGNFILIIIP